MLLAADGSNVSTGTPYAKISKDGGSQATSTFTPQHIGSGMWNLALSQAETNCDHFVATLEIANAITSCVQSYPITPADFKADVSSLATSSEISSLNDFDPSSDTVANVTTVGSVTSAVTTANASDVTAVKTVTDKLDTALVLDGAVYQYTTNALENAPSSGGSGPSASDIYNYFTQGTNEDAFKADVSTLATSAAISALNDFDPSSDPVANVTLVGTCTTNSDMRGTDNANTVAPDNAGIASNGNAIAALHDFDPSSDTVSANVQSVATDAIDAAAIKADAVTEIQSGLATASELANVPKLNTQYTHTAQSGDTIQVTIS